jgi:ribosome biogenesis GTP-binding protein YsxC/EngB
MKITSTKFIKSAFKEPDWPHDEIPEVAFLGRSNVGKSSLINSLLGVRGLARASSTPGRTQSLNFFLINGKFRFVDLPGYGYARAPKAVKAEWSQAASEYLAKREQLVLSIHIVDSRHEPSKQDLQLHEWLRHHRKPHLIVITKSDKLSRNELIQSVKRAAQIFQDTDLMTYSATKRVGREQLWSAIEKSLKG